MTAVDTTTQAELAAILDRYPDAGRDALIPMLQEVQEQQGFLSREAVLVISRHLDRAPSKVYGVATFYNQFRFSAPGKCHIQVCRGTACHVKGSSNVLETIQRVLGIQPGQTTRDGLFSLEVVACIGACGLSPVITCNGDFHAGVSPRNVEKILKQYKQKADQHGRL